MTKEQYIKHADANQWGAIVKQYCEDVKIPIPYYIFNLTKIPKNFVAPNMLLRSDKILNFIGIATDWYNTTFQLTKKDFVYDFNKK